VGTMIRERADLPGSRAKQNKVPARQPDGNRLVFEQLTGEDGMPVFDLGHG
jgi:hypothetical protein